VHPRDAVDRWLHERTHRGAVDPSKIAKSKRDSGLRVSVCLPAFNEADTIGEICSVIVTDLKDRLGIVDEMVVIDSASTDGTADVAHQAGATVHEVQSLMPRYGDPLGKGDALWRSLSALSGDIVMWLDADIRNFSPTFVIGLLAPLLEDPTLQFVKAFYRRPLAREDRMEWAGGARVTEIAARPLLNLLYPQLSGVIQPLSGEYAARRETVAQIPFLTGYAVDVGLLIDIEQRFGLNAMAQADLGIRVHKNKDVHTLGRTAHEVLQGILRRVEEAGGLKLSEIPDPVLRQFTPDGSGSHIYRLPVIERPSMTEALQS
jgi:glucosyl-3-phosphoglycerate synthase